MLFFPVVTYRIKNININVTAIFAQCRSVVNKKCLSERQRLHRIFWNNFISQFIMSVGMAYKPNLHQHIPGTSVNQGMAELSVHILSYLCFVKCKIWCFDEYLGRARDCFLSTDIGSGLSLRPSWSTGPEGSGLGAFPDLALPSNHLPSPSKHTGVSPPSQHLIYDTRHCLNRVVLIPGSLK